MSLTNNNGWSFSSQDFSGPTERMTGLPNIAYMSHEFAKFERDHVLAKTWFCAGNIAQLPANLPVSICQDEVAGLRGAQEARFSRHLDQYQVCA